MSREIEFRIWDLISKEMININDALCSIPYYEIFCHTPDERPWEIMQFTGWTDKHGKKIFEGDIGKTKWRMGPFRIFFYNGSFRGMYGQDEPSENAPGFRLDDYETENTEVIGNIYSNPELLKE